MNNTVRNRKSESIGQDQCKQAFDYDDDVTVEAIDWLRKKAEPILKDGKWKVISGNAAAK